MMLFCLLASKILFDCVLWQFGRLKHCNSEMHAAMFKKPKDICVMLRRCETQESKTNDCASGLVVYKTPLSCCSSYFFITPHSFGTPKSNCGCSPCLPPLSNQNYQPTDR